MKYQIIRCEFWFEIQILQDYFALFNTAYMIKIVQLHKIIFAQQFLQVNG